MVARRRSPDDAVFDRPEPVDDLDERGAVSQGFFLWEPSGEVFFSSSRPWSAGGDGLWRARFCGGPCCDAGAAVQCAGGEQSSDGLHCYERGSHDAASRHRVPVCRERHELMGSSQEDR
jgi:hypothetical protein